MKSDLPRHQKMCTVAHTREEMEEHMQEEELMDLHDKNLPSV